MPRSFSFVRRAIGFGAAVALLLIAASAAPRPVASPTQGRVAIIVCEPCPAPPPQV